MKSAKAFSLSEILIAMALGSMIALVLLQLYQQHNQAYQYQVAMSNATQAGMLASLQMQSVIQRAGYVGCLSLANQHIAVHDDKLAEPIQAMQIIPVQQLPLAIAKIVLNDSEALQVSYMSEDYVVLQEDMQSTHYLAVSEAAQYHAGDRLIVSNCGHADIFIANEVYHKQHQQIIFTQANLFPYKQGDMLAKWEQPIFYLANTMRKRQDGQAIPALYWHETNGEQELQDNIISLKLKSSVYNEQHILKTEVHLITQVQDETFKQIVQLPWQFISYTVMQ